MNPELVRNLWLVLTPRRMIISTVAVALVIGAAAAIDTTHAAGLMATAVFLFVVVLLGARDAAATLAGEIRDRTWDQQRLSALGPWRMVWGKLIGGTAASWCAGAIALVVVVGTYASWFGPTGAALRVYALLWYGLMAQAAALLAALVMARRRTSQSWRDVLGYQITGIAAALAIAGLVPGTDYVALMDSQVVPTLMGAEPEAGIGWVAPAEADVVRSASLALFLAWAWIGCWRLMRRELQMENRPFVWLAFLVFLAGYVAWLGGGAPVTSVAASFSTLLTVAYLMVAIEPKDTVLYRWLMAAVQSGRGAAALVRLPAWVYAYVAAMILGAALVALRAGGVPLALESYLPEEAPKAMWGLARMLDAEWTMVLALMGFATRDFGLFMALALWRQRGAEVAALVVIALLYTAAPVMFASVDASATALFLPVRSLPLGCAFAWFQAVAVWALVWWLAVRMERSGVRVAS